MLMSSLSLIYFLILFFLISDIIFLLSLDSIVNLEMVPSFWNEENEGIEKERERGQGERNHNL